jgi:two-component system, NtrC family, sensor kinase
LPVRVLIGAVAAVPIALLAAAFVSLAASPAIPRWAPGLLLAGCAGSCGVAVLVTREISRRLLELERQREGLYQEFARLSRAASLGEIASGIAHDLNNPLAIMKEEAGWLLDLLKASSLDEEATRQEFAGSVAQITVQIDRASGVTRRLLHWARDVDRPTGVVDVNRLLTRVLYLLEDDLTTGNLRVVRNLRPDLPMAQGSEAELSQVFLHLIKNALDAMKGLAGTLTLSTEVEGETIVTDITDTGAGIPPELLGRIFEPFFTTKPEGEGTGLGLSISSWVLQRAGGRLSVTSAPGLGSTFRVVLRPASSVALGGGTDADRSVAGC